MSEAEMKARLDEAETREKLATAQERIGKLEMAIYQVTREAHQAACLPRGIVGIFRIRSAMKRIMGIIQPL